MGGIGRVQELPLQGRQGLWQVTNKQAVHEVHEMSALWSGQVERQRIQEGFQGR
jgi:hypothetical protein